MAQSFNVLPSGDVENDGWTLVAGSATTVWEVLSALVDDCHVRCPSYRGGVEVSFPTDITSLPDGAVIDSVTVFIKMATNAGSGARGVTVNVLSSENRSRYTQRTLYATSTPTLFEVGTYSKDPLGRAWDIHRINKLRLRIFSYNNLADSVRVYQLYCRVNYHTRPTVTVTTPTGTVGTPSPTINWTYNQLEGEPQASAEYKVFTLTAASVSTFNADTAPPVYSATVSGIGHSYILPTSLNNDSYVVYVRATSSHGAVSTWGSKQFTVSAPSPGIPGDNNAGVAGVPGVGTPTVVPDNYTSSAAIRMQDSSNLLSVQQADFEIASDPLGYVGSNATLTRSTAAAFADGVASLKITASSAADTFATSTKVEIQPSMPITVRSQFLAATTGRTVTLTAQFYDENFVLLGGSVTASGTDVSTTWTEVVATGTTPATAKYVEVVAKVTSPANAEGHYIDHVGVMYGAGIAWSDGGHSSRNILSSYLATGDDPSSSTDSWASANAATTLSRVTATGTGAQGDKCHQMTCQAVSPSIAFRATGTGFNSTTTGKDFTLNKPAGIVDNDLMIAFVTSTEFGTINPPSGWTAVNSAAVDDGTTDIALHVLKRTGLASDPSTWTTGTLSVNSSRRTAVVVAYSGAANSDSQFIAEAVKTDTSGNVTHQTATVVNNDANAWRIAAFAASDNVTGGAFTANLTAPSVAANIAYVGKATSWSTTSDNLSYTLNKPAGVVSGDYMLATVLFNGVISTINTPTGWTLVQKITTAGSGDPHSEESTLVVYRRVAGGSEPNSWTATHNDWGQPKLSQVVAYRNVDTSGTGLITSASSTKHNSASIATASVTNTDSRAWRVCAFGALTPYSESWSGGDVTERVDNSSNLSGFYDTVLSVSDSNGTVGTGAHTRTGTTSDSFVSASSWIGLLKPLSAPPAAGANETERVDTRVGSSNPWETTAVYDSAGVVATGTHSLYGSFTSSDGAADSMASWIGLIRPAASIQGGTIATYTNTAIEISNIADGVLDLAGNKLTMMSDFLGSSAGTPTLTAEFYRANQLISRQSVVGQAFNSSAWTKSWAVFNIPDGTTRIRPVLSALERVATDTVQFDRVGLMLGSLDDSTLEPQWRNGTARSEHPVWSKPIIQYQENDGTGYGEWTLLAGQTARPPQYDLSTAQMFYVDHTIIPLNSRRYRVATLSYGLNGDFFASGYGPASQEAVFEPRAWWLKDIQNLAANMQISVKWKDQDVSTTNMATTFQPIGAKYPVVVTEGFKGDMFPLEIHCEQAEFAALMDLLDSGRTLILQSDIDKMWWVRPVGNISANILATGSRQERPRRYVTVNFVQVAPED